MLFITTSVNLSKHFCVKFQYEITDKEYKIMTDKPQIHWFCPPCDTKVMKNLKN